MAAMTSKLTLNHALRICEGAVATCASRGFAPVCIVVVDANGQQIAAQRWVRARDAVNGCWGAGRLG